MSKLPVHRRLMGFNGFGDRLTKLIYTTLMFMWGIYSGGLHTFRILTRSLAGGLASRAEAARQSDPESTAQAWSWGGQRMESGKDAQTDTAHIDKDCWEADLCFPTQKNAC